MVYQNDPDFPAVITVYRAGCVYKGNSVPDRKARPGPNLSFKPRRNRTPNTRRYELSLSRLKENRLFDRRSEVCPSRPFGCIGRHEAWGSFNDHPDGANVLGRDRPPLGADRRRAGPFRLGHRGRHPGHRSRHDPCLWSGTGSRRRLRRSGSS